MNEAMNCYTIQQPASGDYQIHISAAWLMADGGALFALATNVGSILLIKMPSYGIQGESNTILKMTCSYMKKQKQRLTFHFQTTKKSASLDLTAGLHNDLSGWQWVPKILW